MHVRGLHASRRMWSGAGPLPRAGRTYDAAVHAHPEAAAPARPSPRRLLTVVTVSVAALVGTVLLSAPASADPGDGHIVGQVTVAGSATPPAAVVDVVDADGRIVDSADQAWNGSFDSVVPSGTYWLSLRDPGSEQTQVAESWYPDAPTQRTATRVVVAAGQTVRVGPFTTTAPGTLSGAWQYPAQPSRPDVYGVVTAWRLGEDGGRPEFVSGTGVDQRVDTSWTITGLVPGRYVIRFSDQDGSWATEYLAGTTWTAEAARAVPITVAAGQRTAVPTITLRDPVRDVTRIDGGNRYAVSAAVAARVPGSGGTLYVANGENFPDALTAGPVAAHDHAPLLLVTPTAIPDPVRQAIVGRKPDRIVVVGGPPSVSADVFSQLQGLAPDVQRVTGPDRYAVARRLATDTWGATGAHRAYLANGTGFADALSAGAAAAYDDVPLLITPGQWTADPAAAAVRRSLGVDSLRAVGGEVSLSDAVARDVGGPVYSGRYGGADRYDVSSSLSTDVFASFSGFSDTVYVAVGSKFPDALSGTPLAAVTHSPLVIVKPGCVPEGTLQFIASFGANHVVLLGGPASLNADVAALRSCG